MKLTFLKLFTFLVAASIFTVVIFVKPQGNIGAPSGSFSASISKVFPSAPAEPRILLSSAKGGGVWVNNFYRSAASADEAARAVAIKREGAYDIFYYPDTGRFEIELSLSASLADKAAAEGMFMDILGVGKADVCKLDVTVSELTSSGDRSGSPLTVCQSVFK